MVTARRRRVGDSGRDRRVGGRVDSSKVVPLTVAAAIASLKVIAIDEPGLATAPPDGAALTMVGIVVSTAFGSNTTSTQ